MAKGKIERISANVVNNNPTLAWGQNAVVGSVGGSNLSVTMPGNPNTWRGIVNNLTSTSPSESLSAAQGKVLNDKINGYHPSSTQIRSNSSETAGCCKMLYYSDSAGYHLQLLCQTPPNPATDYVSLNACSNGTVTFVVVSNGQLVTQRAL